MLNNVDELLYDAAEIAVHNQQISITTIQKELGVGYYRATRIMEQLESIGIVSSQKDSEPRKVLVTDFTKNRSEQEGADGKCL